MNTDRPNPLVEWTIQRVEKNKNEIAMFNGSTGSGKTYAAIDYALTLAKRLGTNFTIQDNMDFSFEQLLKKMELPQNQKPGTVFLFEEVGAFGSGSASREWQSQANKFFFSFAQTSRHRNQILLMTCPMMTYLDAGTRQLLHIQFVMNGINHHLKVSYAKPFVLQTNYSTGKVYKKFLRIKTAGGKIKLRETVFNLPPKDIIDQYESAKTKFTTALYKQMFKPKEKKDNNKLNDQLCPFCEWKWESRVKEPKSCPKCHKYIIYMPKTLGNQVQGGGKNPQIT